MIRQRSLNDVFPDSSSPPYIVLMESTRPGKNLGKYDRLALAKCVDVVIRGGRTIFYNGINQLKIHYEVREDANTLVCSQDLMRGNFKLFIPSSLIHKKVFTSPRDVTMAVRKRMNENGSLFAKVEFTMAVACVPCNISLLGYSYPLIPAIPLSRRCFT